MNEAALLARIGTLQGEVLPTPSKRKSFTVTRVASDRVTVTTGNANRVDVTIAGMLAVLRYLDENDHDRKHPCRIRSHNDPALAGPLCLAGRGGRKIRTITYALPMLEHLGMVGIDATMRPMTAFLAHRPVK